MLNEGAALLNRPVTPVTPPLFSTACLPPFSNGVYTFEPGHIFQPAAIIF